MAGHAPNLRVTSTGLCRHVVTLLGVDRGLLWPQAALKEGVLRRIIFPLGTTAMAGLL